MSKSKVKKNKNLPYDIDKIVDVFPKLEFPNQKVSVYPRIKVSKEEKLKAIKSVLAIVRKNEKYIKTLKDEQNGYSGS